MKSFTLAPRGPFALSEANRYFGGWPTLAAEPGAIVMAFPVEGDGWPTSAAVVVRQTADGREVRGDVYGADGEAAESARPRPRW